MRIFAIYGSAFLLIISFLLLNYQAGGAESGLASLASSQELLSASSQQSSKSSISVDQLAAANVATSLAEATSLPIAGDLREATTTLGIKKQLSQTDADVITKPQIVQPETSTKRGLTTYVTKDGDTMETIAKHFGISAQTLRWANSMKSDAVEVGKTLIVPRTDGVVYTVKDGDTVDGIAAKYKVNAERIVLYNDLDNKVVLAKDTKLVLPNGDLPETERPGYVAPARPSQPTRNYSYGNISYGSMNGSVISRSYGYPGPTPGNRYAAGNCTWYAYERRASLGRPIGGNWGNAYSWGTSAIGAGYLVNNNPAPGAVMQTSAGGGGYGHVAVVEIVGDDYVIISDMNYAGYNVVTSRKMSLETARRHNFIH